MPMHHSWWLEETLFIRLSNCHFPAVASQNISHPLDQIVTGLYRFEIPRTEDDAANLFDDKSIEGGKNPVCDEVVTEDISRTIFEEFAEAVNKEVEVHNPPAEGHK